MAVSEDLTKLSDELRRLSSRADEAEKRVAAAREKSKADIEADRDAARTVLPPQAGFADSPLASERSGALSVLAA